MVWVLISIAGLLVEMVLIVVLGLSATGDGDLDGDRVAAEHGPGLVRRS